jgi:hypothetical protein
MLHHRHPHQTLTFILQIVKLSDIPDAHISVADNI